MSADDLFRLATVDQFSGDLIGESPPDWWNEYPFEPEEPEWDFSDAAAAEGRLVSPGPAPRVVGPSCVPVPISSIEALYYITPIANLPSIRDHGILSHKGADSVPHLSVADPEINAKRATKHLPSGKVIHDYANLFFNPRNPMLYRLLNSPDNAMRDEPLCVLKIAHTILWRTNVLISDGNARSDRTTYWPREDGCVRLDRERVFAGSWNDEIEAQKQENKRCIMAEALIPGRVPIAFIKCVYVRNRAERELALAACGNFPVEVRRDLFF